MSSVNPSARAARSELLPLYLNGNTATQNPSSARTAPAFVRDFARSALAVIGPIRLGESDESSFSGIESPALRRPSRIGSIRPLAKCHVPTFERARAANSG